MRSLHANVRTPFAYVCLKARGASGVDIEQVHDLGCVASGFIRVVEVSEQRRGSSAGAEDQQLAAACPPVPRVDHSI